MERPSHIDIRLPRPVSSRLTLLGVAISLPLVILWALTHGMGTQIIDRIGPLVFVPDRDPVKPQPPPSSPDFKPAPRITVDTPLVVIDQPSKPQIFVAPATQPATTQPPQPAGPDRAVAGVMATHTSPPYPALAIRQGLQGKVTLRLTVRTDGHVGKADIVTSSGNSDLDEAAQSWIVAHWLYKPALDKGQPVASQVLATMVFNLRDVR